MINKRGQGMSTNAIILIILGVVVLVVLILGFTLGWQKLAPWFSKNNVDTIVTACEASCSTNGIYDFCMVGRNLKAEDTKLKGVTCNYLAKNQTAYGVSKCTSVPCDNVRLVEAASIGELANHCTAEIITVQALIGDTLESHTCA
jgi:hypothetical protein